MPNTCESCSRVPQNAQNKPWWGNEFYWLCVTYLATLAAIKL
jgi:hypothetical protein